MTLLITILAAAICTALWYKRAPHDEMRISTLCFIYWGASLMWLVDAVAEYIEIGSAYFQPEPAAMLNDAFLGLTAVVFGMVIWIITLFVKDPRNVIRRMHF